MKNNPTRVLVALAVLVIVIVGMIWFFHGKTKTVAPRTTAVLSVSVFDQTQNKDATLVTAQPNDVVVFTLTAENQTSQVISGYIVEANISEISNNSTLIDAQGASYNSATNSLVWTPLDIPANASIQKQFSVRVNQLAANASNDILRIKFNNQVQVSLSHPVVAGASQTPPPAPYKAPVTGPEGDLGLWLALATTAGYFISTKIRSRKA